MTCVRTYCKLREATCARIKPSRAVAWSGVAWAWCGPKSHAYDSEHHTFISPFLLLSSVPRSRLCVHRSWSSSPREPTLICDTCSGVWLNQVFGERKIARLILPTATSPASSYSQHHMNNYFVFSLVATHGRLYNEPLPALVWLHNEPLPTSTKVHDFKQRHSIDQCEWHHRSSHTCPAPGYMPPLILLDFSCSISLQMISIITIMYTVMSRSH